MESLKLDSALDLRKIRMAPDLPQCPPHLPSFNVFFPRAHLYGPSSDLDSTPVASTPQISPALAITQRVLKAAFNRTGKPTRPFKAYPKNPLCLSMNTEATKALDCSSNQAYLEFRQRMLLQISSSCLKTKRSSSPGEGSVTSASGCEQDQDPAYWERRRKNNEAAKRSRDARRAKEDEIAIRAAFLEQENIKLKYRVIDLGNELTRLRCILYSRH